MYSTEFLNNDFVLHIVTNINNIRTKHNSSLQYIRNNNIHVIKDINKNINKKKKKY